MIEKDICHKVYKTNLWEAILAILSESLDFLFLLLLIYFLLSSQFPFAFLIPFFTFSILHDCCRDGIILVITTNIYGVLIMCQALF